MKILLALLLFAGIANAQVAPPQPDYSQYGSYSRQLRVYEAVQRRQADLERQKYRKFRAEVRRDLARRERQRTTYVVRDHYGRERWRERRRITRRQYR